MTVLGKNNMLKRITAFVLALLMVFTLIPWGTNVAKAEEGEPVMNQYTFTVTDNTGALIEGATVTIFKTVDANAGYDLTLESKVVLTTDANGQCMYTISEEEFTAAKDWSYTVTYTRDVTDEETNEVTTMAYATHRAKLGTELSISVSLQPAKGVSGKIYITNEDTLAQFLDVCLMQGEDVIQQTKSNSNGEYIFDIVDDGSYTIKVQNQNYTSDSCVKEITTFVGEAGKIQELEKIILTPKEKTTVLTFTDTTKILAVNDTYTNVLTMNPEVNKESEEGYTLTYSSDNESVATVDVNGQVTAQAIGTAKITVTFYSDTYQVSTADYTVTVPGIQFSGTVKDMDGKTLDGAMIYLVSSDATLETFLINQEYIKTTILASNGEYAFTYDKVGEKYKLIVVCEGYKYQLVEIEDTTENKVYEIKEDIILEKPVTVAVKGSAVTSDQESIVGEKIYLLIGSVSDLKNVELSDITYNGP